MSDIGTTLTSSCARCAFTHNRAHGQPRLHGPESLQFLGSVFLRLLFSIIAQLDSHWDRLVICSLCFAIRLPFPPPIVQQISLRDPSDSILFFFFFFCISFCDNLPIFLVCVWGRRQRIWWKESDSWQRSLFKQLTPFVLTMWSNLIRLFVYEAPLHCDVSRVSYGTRVYSYQDIVKHRLFNWLLLSIFLYRGGGRL